MVFPWISNAKTTTFNTYGGDALNKIQQLLSGVNIADVDSTNKPTINTEFRFYTSRFKILDFDGTNELTYYLPPITENVGVIFPANLTGGTNYNEFLFAKLAQTIENKTINAASNAISNISNTNISTTAAIAWSKISKTGSALGDIANINLTGLGHGYSIKWDSVTSKWVVYDAANTIGEANTISNLTGTAGAVGIFKQKTGVNFELKKINSGSTSVTITDDTPNNEIDINVVDATTSLKGKVELATDGENAANVVVQGNDSRLSDDRTALPHAASHKSGGDDVIKINELGAPTANITTTNVTITANGTAPMLPNNASLFLNGVGNWTEPVGTASGVSGTGSLIRGTATTSGNGTTKVFTIAHGMSITPSAWFADAVTVDALGLFTRTVDLTNITITYQVAPPSGTNNLKWTWAVMDAGTGSTMGEANTYSSVGTGVPITKTKVGVDLPFRSLFAGSTRISIVQNTNDVSFDVNQANLAIAYSQLTGVPATLVKTDQANTYGAFMQSFRSSMAKLMNPANTFGYTLVGSAITANRNLTLPLLTADDDLVTRTFAQTLTNKTLTSPVISTIVNTGTLTLPTSTDTLVGRATTDIMSNKTLMSPTIATILNGTATLTLPTVTDTIMGRTTTDTQTNKTVVLANNTVTDTGAAAGAIPVHNGTRFVKLDKGADGSFLGVSGGSVGYFTPATGSGGLLPAGDAVPITGRWGALWGGNLSGDGILQTTPAYNTVTYEMISPTSTATVINTAAADDSVAELKSGAVFSRQSNIVFKAKWASKQTSNCVIRIGLTSQATLPTGSSHDSPLNNASGVLIVYVSDIETNYRVARNSGAATDTDVTTTIPGNTTAEHTCTINLNTNDCVVTLDDVVIGTYTTALPALTTPLYVVAHIESIGSSAKGLGIRYMQVTSL